MSEITSEVGLDLPTKEVEITPVPKLIDKVHAVGIGHDGNPSWLGEILKMLPVVLLAGGVAWGVLETRAVMYRNSIQKEMNDQVEKANAEREVLQKQAELLQTNADSRQRELEWSIRRNDILEKSRDEAVAKNKQLEALLQERLPSRLLR